MATRESIPRFDVSPSTPWFVARWNPIPISSGHERGYTIPCIWQAEFSSVHLYSKGNSSSSKDENRLLCGIISLSPSLPLSLCAKVYWTVKITVIDEQCDGKFVFWVCAYKRVFEIFFFFSIKFWLPLNGMDELSCGTNECFRIFKN